MTFAPVAPSNPMPGFRFAVAFSGGAPIGGFQEVSGLESTLEMHEYKEGGRNDFTHKLPTQANFTNLSLKRGVALTPDLWSWYDEVRRGSFGARRELLVAQLNYEGRAALVWYVRRALPTKYTGPSWNAAQSAVAVETLEVAHEGLDLVEGTAFA